LEIRYKKKKKFNMKNAFSEKKYIWKKKKKTYLGLMLGFTVGIEVGAKVGLFEGAFVASVGLAVPIIGLFDGVAVGWITCRKYRRVN